MARLAATAPVLLVNNKRIVQLDVTRQDRHAFLARALRPKANLMNAPLRIPGLWSRPAPHHGGAQRPQLALGRLPQAAAATMRSRKFLFGEDSGPGNVIAGGQEVRAARGAAAPGFPTGLKWSFMPQQFRGRQVPWSATPTKASPGTFKDRDIMRYNPHILIEGDGDSAAYAMGCKGAPTTTSTAEIWDTLRALRGSSRGKPTRPGTARRQHPGQRLPAFNLLQPSRATAAYICGRGGRPLLESLEGKKGQPRFKPPFPASFGLYGKPTTINNTETFRGRALDHPQRGRAGSSTWGRPKQRRHQDLLRVRATSNAPGNFRGEAGKRRSPSCWKMAGGMRGGAAS